MINRRKFLKSVASLPLIGLPTQLISKEPELKYFKNYCSHTVKTTEPENFNLKNRYPYVRYVTFPAETTLKIVEKDGDKHIHHLYKAFNTNHDAIANMSIFDIEKCVVLKNDYASELNIYGSVFKLIGVCETY
jgi:hypothetical protein